MNPRYNIAVQLLLLCLFVVGAYSPAFRGEPSLVDDVDMLKDLRDSTPVISIKGLVAPPSATQLTYHRPLIEVSYWCSKVLWNANPQAMHTENVFFHLINVLLLFWLIRIAIPESSSEYNRYAPFLGALLFAVHPITTESVNWISGRTDLLAGGCMIAATISILNWQKQKSHWWYLLIAMIMLAGAIKTKEVAWGFLLVLPLFLAEPYDSAKYTLREFISGFIRLEKLLIITAVALCFMLAAVLLSFWPVILLSAILGLVVFYRKQRPQPLSRNIFILLTLFLVIVAAMAPYLVDLAQKSTAGISSNFARTLLLINLDFDNSISIFSAAVAFYIKKFFLPLPLSFAIIGTTSLYLFAGIAMIILTAFLVAWRSQAAIFFLAGLSLLLLALPLVHNQIAWVPFAERYIYMSSFFWVVSLAVALSTLQHSSLRTSAAFLSILLVPAATLITYKRSVVWQTNVALFEDTLKKTPDHLISRIFYMTALAEAGKLPEALQQYRRIQANTPDTWVKYTNILVDSLLKGGLKHEAWEVLDTSLVRAPGGGRKHPVKHPEWEKMYKLYEKMRLELHPEKPTRINFITE